MHQILNTVKNTSNTIKLQSAIFPLSKHVICFRDILEIFVTIVKFCRGEFFLKVSLVPRVSAAKFLLDLLPNNFSEI